MFINLLIWTIWTCILFLPSMHERYSYLLDILFIIAIFLKTTNFIGAPATIALLCSLSTYENYLFGIGTNVKFLGLLYIFAYINYTWQVWHTLPQSQTIAKE